MTKMNAVVLSVFACLLLVKSSLAGYGSSSNSGGSTNPAGTATKYRVTTLVSPPFVNEADEDGKLTGIIVELLDAMKASGNFDYTLKVSATELYGDSFPNGTANGMIGEVQNGEADIIAADLTQTYNRSLVVDFTEIFTLSILRIAVNKNYDATTAKYITINSTAVQTYLQKNTLSPLTKKIWASIKAGGEDSIVTSYEEGIQRVAAGENIGFVADTPYVIIEQQKLNSTVVFTADNLAHTFFAFAVKAGSPNRRFLNQKLLQLNEDGTSDNIIRILPSVCKGSSA